jgi:phosphoglycolate phosphatase-like HAD superfamily hydrolase
MNREIKKLFRDNIITFVLFDMDRTLVDTHTYFQEEMTNSILHTVSKIFPTKPLKKQLKITKEIVDIANKIYEQQKYPILVDTLSKLALSQYIKEKKVKINKKEVYKVLKSSYKEFYLTSPQPFPYTIEAIHKIKTFNIPIGVYSHAQKQWTNVKVEKIRNEYFKKYGEDIKIPFFTTNITDLKDKEGWIKAGKYHKIDPKRTLVVGDSLTADIYAAIDAGYKYLVYLSHTNRSVEVEQKALAKIFIAKNLSTVFN